MSTNRPASQPSVESNERGLAALNPHMVRRAAVKEIPGVRLEDENPSWVMIDGGARRVVRLYRASGTTWGVCSCLQGLNGTGRSFCEHVARAIMLDQERQAA